MKFRKLYIHEGLSMVVLIGSIRSWMKRSREHPQSGMAFTL